MVITISNVVVINLISW